MMVVVLSPIGLELILWIQAFPAPHHVKVQLSLPVLQNNGKLERPRIFIAFLVDSNPDLKISRQVVEVEAGILERVLKEP